MAIGFNSMIKDERLQLPLYHGTSDLFFDSIREHGLGSKNPIEELGVLKTLKRVVQLADVQLKEDDNYVGLRWMYQNFINQKSGHQNWQHGQVYVSASKALANSYAINPYGSEIINETISLYNRLIDTSSIALSENPVLNLIGKDYKPIIFQLDNYPIKSLGLEKENDKSVEDVIKMIFKAEGMSFQIFSQGLNFRLLEPVSFSQLRLVDVEFFEKVSLKEL